VNRLYDRFVIRWLVLLVVIAVAAIAGTYALAGRGAPPRVTIEKPDRFVGQAGTLEVVVDAPVARLSSLTMVLEQGGRTTPLFALDATQGAVVTEIDPGHLRVSRPLGKASVPALQAGAARVIVSVARPSFLKLRTLASVASRDFQVRLEPPRVAVVSMKHYVNHGGSELVVYRATPPDVRSGVRVGTIEYPGFPLGGDLKGAFFALLHDQELKTPIAVFARDEAGNDAQAAFVDNVFEKPFKKSRIELDDKFLNRIVPEILQHSSALNTPPPPEGGDMLAPFLKINGELRAMNSNEIAAFAAKTSPMRVWNGPFVQLGNSKVEAAFADHRTYFYRGRQVDQQFHLGFDLAVTANVPVVAANNGTVLNASWLGIFGNCVIIDHGMGVQSLYGHLSAFDVKPGDTVTKGQTIGRSGMTGLAGGDHLHFTMLVGGHPVNPVEWWDAHWIQDRVDRKLLDAAGDSPSRQPGVAATRSTASRPAIATKTRNRGHRK
jgi:murein DD-endopeptidase MepM/ murein hydrolase activator NlpD